MTLVIMGRDGAEKGQKEKTWSEMGDEGRAQTLVESGESLAHALRQSSNVAGMAGKGRREVLEEDDIKGDSRRPSG